MAQDGQENIDPRIRRTRLLLQQALGKLLESKEFDDISVMDITEAATVNRATFYDHYNDKSGLLQCMVGTRFGELLDARGVRFDGGCSSAMRAIILGVCDYLESMPWAQCERQSKSATHMEGAVIAVVRRMLLDGLAKHPPQGISAEMLAATLSWAMYGAAKEWVLTPNRCSSDEIADTVMALISPMFNSTFSETPVAAEMEIADLTAQ